MSDTLTLGRNSAVLEGPDFGTLPLAAGSLCEYVPLGFDAGDANLYRYVGNDPVNETDPDGLQAHPLSRPTDPNVRTTLARIKAVVEARTSAR